MSLWQWANPVKFLQLSRKIRRLTDPLAIGLVSIALIWGFFFTAPDYRQGATVKIMFVHVPAAMSAINVWIMMVIASLIWLIRRHHVSAMAAKAAAPIGLVMTVVALATGALWGQPMWGTYWAWDPRLTSFFVLFLFYVAYIALWSSLEDYQLAADMTSILALVGGVFAILSRYAVNFWNQGLHQSASVSVTDMSQPDQHLDVYFYPLMIGMIGFVFFCISLMLYRTETEILSRRLEALRTQEGDADA